MRTKCHSKNSAIFLPPCMDGGLQETARAGKISLETEEKPKYIRPGIRNLCMERRERGTNRRTETPPQTPNPPPPPPRAGFTNEKSGDWREEGLLFPWPGCFAEGEKACLLCCERGGRKGGGLPLKFLLSPLGRNSPLRKGIRRKQLILNGLRFPQCLQDFSSRKKDTKVWIFFARPLMMVHGEFPARAVWKRPFILLPPPLSIPIRNGMGGGRKGERRRGFCA